MLCSNFVYIVRHLRLNKPDDLSAVGTQPVCDKLGIVPPDRRQLAAACEDADVPGICSMAARQDGGGDGETKGWFEWVGIDRCDS